MSFSTSRSPPFKKVFDEVADLVRAAAAIPFPPPSDAGAAGAGAAAAAAAASALSTYGVSGGVSTTAAAQPIAEWRHPKFAKVVALLSDHFEQNGADTRAIVFANYRDTIDELIDVLQRSCPAVKPESFVGQASAGKGKGMQRHPTHKATSVQGHPVCNDTLCASPVQRHPLHNATSVQGHPLCNDTLYFLPSVQRHPLRNYVLCGNIPLS